MHIMCVIPTVLVVLLVEFVLWGVYSMGHGDGEFAERMRRR